MSSADPNEASTSRTSSRTFGRDPGSTGNSTRTPNGETARTGRETSTPKPPAGSTKWPQTHTVAEGESLWAIAEQKYGKGHLYTLIEKANGLTADENLSIGRKLTLPAPPKSTASTKTPARTPSTPATKPGFESYTIEDGDTLYDIAEERLGNGLRWTEIQEANPNLDPSSLRIGMKILVPSS